ncbi:MAG: phenylalanine--tRNA ligase subunit beta [Thermodesulfobacteriota bacterium]|nr:phenylalanine--tRNA ligase subunit beta [Thermodesulfobacteriota bacterium]
MKASIGWLNDYTPINMDVHSLANALTMAGLEVEAVTDRFGYLDKVVVGRIVEIEPHPNADKLKLVKVDVGRQTLAVVCGAPNVSHDILAPVALPGTVFPNGFTLEKSIIRKVESEGMICSEAELELGKDKSGIMILSPSLPVGEKLSKALKLSDAVIEVDLTPNRPDCLSMIGIAREICGIQKTKIKYPDMSLDDPTDDISGLASVTIKDPDHCPRYAARLLTDITVGPSPFWLADRLLSVGLKPINNIVDITNFVLMETGQPLHAFDYDRLAENRIVVRRANEGELFTTLDMNERKLTADMLMICDGEKPVAVGGVMGGLNSEIEETTTKVLIESAYFDPISIRKTSKKLGLNTEASHRFERGVDPEGTVPALNRAARLMVEIGGGKLVKGIIDEYPKKIPPKTIRLKISKTNRLLGTQLSRDDIKELLESIGLSVKKNDADTLTVVPPSFRVDIERPEDLMEEVARLSGYNNIPTTFPSIPAKARKPMKQLDTRRRILQLMTGFGFCETINYSFINSLSCDRLNLPTDDYRRNTVDIINPLTEDQTVMRTSLVPGLLETAYRNISKQQKNLKLFEMGKIYIKKDEDSLPEETEMLAGLWTGVRLDDSWYAKETPCDFFDLKGAVEGLLKGLSIDSIRFSGLANDLCVYTKPGYTAEIFSAKEHLGLVGEIHPLVLGNFNLKQAVYIFELSLDRLNALLPDTRQSKPIPKFPAVSRDITVIVNQNTESGAILECIQNIQEQLVESMHLFDVFAGDPIPPGKKSVSIRVTYRSNKKTLEDEDVGHIHKAMTDRLIKEFDAGLPE